MFIFAKEILNGQFIFVQVNRQKTTVKKKITYFLKNYVASLFTFFEKVLLYFICLKFNPQYWYFLPCRGENMLI